MSFEDSEFLGGFWCEGGREFLRQLASLGPWGEAGSSRSGVCDGELRWPSFRSGSSDLSEAGEDSSLGRRLASTLLLVSGLESVIVRQIFNQEKVRQEKTRQVRKRSKTIQTTCQEKRESFTVPTTRFLS